jgi:plastocyanin
MNETLFYVLGITLAVVAVGVSFLGLRNEERFPSTALMRLTALGFAALVAATAAFAVLNARDEQEQRRAELASEEQAAPEPAPAPAPVPSGGGAAASPSGQGKKAGGAGAAKPSGQANKASGGGAKPSSKGKGPGGTLKLAADPTAIAYDTKQLSSKPGEVTIDFDNPSQVEHDVAIESGGKEIAKSELVAQGKASVSAELSSGSYTFFCTVPGHREAGMEGTLTVK